MSKSRGSRKHSSSRRRPLSVWTQLGLLGVLVFVAVAAVLLVMHLMDQRRPSRRAAKPAQSSPAATVPQIPKPDSEPADVAPDDEEKKTADQQQPAFADLLEQGVAALRDGKSAQAVKLLKQACALNPDSPDAWLAVIGAFRAAQDHDQAWQSCERALGCAVGDLTELRRQFSHLARDCGRATVALKQAEEILAGHPDDGDAHLVAAQTLLNLGRSNTALEHASQAVRLSPESLAAQVALGRALAEENRPAEAVPILRRVLADHPGSPHASLALAKALRILGDEKGAKEALAAVDEQLKGGRLVEAVMPVDGKLPAGVLNSEQAVAAMAAAERAELLLRDGKGKEAIAVYQRLADDNPELAPVHYRLAELMLLSGRTDTARKMAEAQLERDPASAGAHTILAQVYLSTNLVGMAEEECTKALAGPAGNPAVITARKLLAIARNRGGDAKQAVTEMETYLLLRPNDLDAIIRLSAFQQGAGSPGKAVQTLRAAEEKFGNAPALFTQEARLLVAADNKPEAIKALQRAIELGANGATNYLALASMQVEEEDIVGATASARAAREKAPASHLAADALGWCLVLGDRLDEALPHLELAVKLAPWAPRYRFHHAVLLERQKKVSTAVTELRAALASPRQFPEREEAEKLLATLDKAQ